MTIENAGTHRARYRREGIEPNDLKGGPLLTFQKWMNDWISVEPYNPRVVVLATADARGYPSARVMDLLGLDHGFLFASAEGSRKATDFGQTYRAALCFNWGEIGRQVRVCGTISQLNSLESGNVFAALPRSLQLAAWSSRQSSKIDGRETMIKNMTAIQARFRDQPIIPRSSDWFGYRLIPLEIEFWQQRPDELQDRVLVTRSSETERWHTARLAP